MNRIYRCIPALMLAIVACSGCNSLQQTGATPPQSYIQAHRATHNAAAHVYQKFEQQNPEEAQAASDLYQSEEVLITNAESGKFPTTLPAAP